MKLLRKEFTLCMHPAAYVMLLLSAMVLIPGYPYGVSCFYMALGIYFICLSARENHDAAYTLTLPVSRRDAVAGRILFCALLELVQLLLMGLFTVIKYAIGTMLNPAGLDAGLALIGEGFLIFTLFNLIFFPIYYRDINKPGKAFATGSIAVFLWVAGEVVATYAVPFVQYVLDTPDPAHMSEKALFTLGGLALWAGGTYSVMLRSTKRFETADLSL